VKRPVTEYYHRYKRNPLYDEKSHLYQSPKKKSDQEVIDSVRKYVSGTIPET